MHNFEGWLWGIGGLKIINRKKITKVCGHTTNLHSQALQQGQKDELDRIRAKAFKKRGLTFSVQKDLEEFY